MPSTILHVTITVDPSNAGEFLKHFKPAYEAVIAEPQCNLFRVLTNPEAPGVFIFIEEWTESVEWLMKVRRHHSEHTRRSRRSR